MPPRAVLQRNRRIRIQSRHRMSRSTEGIEKEFKTKARIEEIVDETADDEFVDIHEHGRDLADLPPWLDLNSLFLQNDSLSTTSSEAESKVTNECLPYLLGDEDTHLPRNSHGLPKLRRVEHAAFLRSNLARLPAPYVAMDASRPWMFYWVIAGLSFLGEDVSMYKERLVQTLAPLQNRTGGFGGGHGQYSHAAGTYACVLALTCVEALDMVDRKAMWHFLGHMKHRNGGFLMAEGAEEDVRGAYCAMIVIALLNLPIELPPDAPARAAGLETFLDGLGEWISRCQTYEGGIAGAPSNEAHGAYTFCALACLSIMDAPHHSIPKYIDIPALIPWLAASQTVPAGGFQGRTNKLVDACYSHWSGGCWSLLQAALQTSLDLWSREAQIRYLLCCCQDSSRRGGMRDKPSMRADAYHTCYSLSGLSNAQNHYHYAKDNAPIDEKSGRLIAAFNWKAGKPTAEEAKAWAFDEHDRVDFVHPVFAIPIPAVESARARFPRSSF